MSHPSATHPKRPLTPVRTGDPPRARQRKISRVTHERLRGYLHHQRLPNAPRSSNPSILQQSAFPSTTQHHLDLPLQHRPFARREPIVSAAAPGRGTSWVVDFVLLAAIWGSSFLFMKTASTAFGPWATAALRVGIAAAVLLPVLWAKQLLRPLHTHWRPLALAGVLNSGIPFVCFGFALLHISTGLSAILNATVPLFGALIAWAWLKQGLTRWRVVGLAVGFGGVALLTLSQLRPVSAPQSPDAAWGVAACLAATLCYGLAASFTQRHLKGLPSLVTSAGSQLGALALLWVPAVITWPAVAPTRAAWLSVAVAGVVCTALAYILYFRLIESAGPARALSVTFAIPVFALAYGWALLGEPVTLETAGWGLVVLLGTALSSGMLPRPSRNPEPPAGP